MKKIITITLSIMMLVFTIINEYLIYTWIDIDWVQNPENMGFDIVLLCYPMVMAFLILISPIFKGAPRLVCCVISGIIGCIVLVFGLILSPLMFFAVRSDAEILHYMSIVLCDLLCIVCVVGHFVLAIRAANEAKKNNINNMNLKP